MSYITKSNDGKPLYQLNKGTLNVKTLSIPLKTDLSAAATLRTLIFPFDIHVLGLGITNGGVAPTGGVDIAITLTDGTNPMTVTMLGAGAVPVQSAQDQIYTKNTELDIDNAAGVGNITEQAILHIHYTPILPTVR